MFRQTDHEIVVYKDEETTKSRIGVKYNKIVELKNFLDSKTCNDIIRYLDSQNSNWDSIAFYNSQGMGFYHEDPRLSEYDLYPGFFQEITKNFQEAVEFVFDKKVKPNTSHAQRWLPGGFAPPHSDNSDISGEPSSFEINKYVCILYLNDDYDGGELFFPQHKIEIKPSKGSLAIFPGGVENIHGVHKIKDGLRYTIVAFWDFEDAEYSEERLAWHKEHRSQVKKEQEQQKKEWAMGVYIEEENNVESARRNSP